MTGQHKHDLKEVIDSTCILVFGYKRDRHMSTTLKALSSNVYASDLPVRIYVDGPRNPESIDAIHKVIRVSSEDHGFKTCKVIASSQNQGLYNAITAGVSDALNIYEQVIVIEDDIVTSPHFLEYMLDALTCYRDNPKVSSIHGYTPSLKGRLPETFFLRGADCWGWATWKDKWKLFRSDAGNMAKEITDRGLAHEFDLMGSYQYLEMLQKRSQNSNNSWAICWHASCFLAGMYTLHPGRSLVENIGLDGSGENCQASRIMKTRIRRGRVTVRSMPVVQDRRVFLKYCKHYASTPSGRKRLYNRIRLFASAVQSWLGMHTNNTPWLSLRGPYRSYAKAKQNSRGYDSPVILEKVKSAITKVLEGESAYERDGTVFDVAPENLKILDILAHILEEDSDIVDFGGGLGGLYINHRHVFGRKNKYTVIEQPSFAQAGNEIVQQYKLPISFKDTLLSAQKADILVMSGVLQYLPDLDSVIHASRNLAPRYILIDRTAVAKGRDTLWWLQYMPEYYGEPVSYPVRPVSIERLLEQLHDYRVVDRWVSDFDPHLQHIGILLKRAE